jgi:hypothetical protein
MNKFSSKLEAMLFIWAHQYSNLRLWIFYQLCQIFRITDAYLSIRVFWYMSPLYKELALPKCFWLHSVIHGFRIYETVLRNCTTCTHKPVIPKLYHSTSRLKYYSPRVYQLHDHFFSLLRLIWHDIYPLLNLYICFINHLFLKGKEERLNSYPFLSELSLI